MSATALRRARRRQTLRRNLTAYLFLAPGLVFFGAFLVLPVAWVVRQSFLQGGVLGPPTWVGLENWSRALGDPALITAAKEDLARRLKGTPYRSPIPPEVNPPLDMSR